jgi:hypothetical protein
VHVEEAGFVGLAPPAELDALAHGALPALAPLAADLVAIHLVAPHAARHRDETRVGGDELERVAVGHHDPGVGIGLEEPVQAPEVPDALQHPALAGATPLHELELAAVRRVDGGEIRALDPGLIGRDAELMGEDDAREVVGLEHHTLLRERCSHRMDRLELRDQGSSSHSAILGSVS